MSRLDWFLINEDWDSMFGNVVQWLLPKPDPYHFPISLDGGGVMVRGPSSFHFENMWLKEKGSKDLIRGWWQGFIFRGSRGYILAQKIEASQS